MSVFEEKLVKLQPFNKKMEKSSKEDILNWLSGGSAANVVFLLKVLRDQLGLEKAIDVVRKAKLDWFSKIGKAWAEKYGNPQDLESFMHAYWNGFMNQVLEVEVEYNKISDKKWVALETVLEERQVRELIPQLKQAGAEGIIEYPLNKIVY